jgi:hypothetical protein
LAFLPIQVIKMPINSAFVVAVSGLAILTAPPFRPQFFPATLLLSDLFQITLVFFCFMALTPGSIHLQPLIPGGST